MRDTQKASLLHREEKREVGDRGEQEDKRRNQKRREPSRH